MVHGNKRLFPFHQILAFDIPLHPLNFILPTYSTLLARPAYRPNAPKPSSSQ